MGGLYRVKTLHKIFNYSCSQSSNNTKLGATFSNGSNRQSNARSDRNYNNNASKLSNYVVSCSSDLSYIPQNKQLLSTISPGTKRSITYIFFDAHKYIKIHVAGYFSSKSDYNFPFPRARVHATKYIESQIPSFYSNLRQQHIFDADDDDDT